MSYIINFSEQALADVDRLKVHEPKAYEKFLSFLSELSEHPRTGTGHRTTEGAPRRTLESSPFEKASAYLQNIRKRSSCVGYLRLWSL